MSSHTPVGATIKPMAKKELDTIDKRNRAIYKDFNDGLPTSQIELRYGLNASTVIHIITKEIDREKVRESLREQAAEE